MKKAITLFFLLTFKLTGYCQHNTEQATEFFSRFQNASSVAAYIFDNLPTLEECRHVFKGTVADTFYTRIIESKPARDNLKDLPEQSFEGVKISTFTSEDVMAERGNYAGGMNRIKDVFMPGVVFYKVSFLKQKEDEYGVAFKYFVLINNHWVMFPKPYDLLSSLKDNDWK